VWLNEWFYGGQVRQPPVSPPGEPPASTFANIGAGFRDDGWLDIWGSPLTSGAKITERFRRLSYGVLKIDVTIDDPKAYTKPFSVRVNQRIMPDGELIEFICNENNKAPQLMVGK
jgi:hypothetical protein